MRSQENNYAFIDGQNIYQSIRSQGWNLDWRKFRVYLQERYGVNRAYIFIGYLPQNNSLYEYLRRSGFTLIFKPTFKVYVAGRSVMKGNVDAELVLQTMIDYSLYDQAVIVSGDSDFYCLLRYLSKQKKLRQLIIPDEYKYSWLLKSFGLHVTYMNRLKQKIDRDRKNKKTPR